MDLNIEEKLWRKIKKWSFILNKIPFIKAIFVCNSLSFSKVDTDSDIDLFVVTKSSRLFMTRFFLTFFLQIFALRRHGNKVAGRFCLSFYIDEKNLDLNRISKNEDFYLAFWIKNLKPVVLNDFSPNLLFENNVWIKNLFIDTQVFDFSMKYHFSKFSYFRNFLEKVFSGKFGDFFENILRSFQLKRAYKKQRLVDSSISSIVISDSMLKFHNNDKRDVFNLRFRKSFPDKKIDDTNFLSVLD